MKVIDRTRAAQTNLAELDYFEGQVLLMNKPYGWTSFQLVKKVKYILKHHYGVKKIKVGHAGTLDPLASGLLILCIGRMTKRIEAFQEMAKTYRAEMKTGATTPSYDKETNEDATYPYNHITGERVQQVFSSFLGEQKQYPPVFSAKKINGKRAYESARKGENLQMRPSWITIYQLQLLWFEKPLLEFEVTCSRGTYIRTLVHDMGEALQSGAYLTNLVRTRIGDYRLEDSVDLQQFSKWFENK